MSATIDSWEINPADVGPIYPFTGWEMMMFAAAALFCVGFMIWKFKSESEHYAERARALKKDDDLSQSLGDD